MPRSKIELYEFLCDHSGCPSFLEVYKGDRATYDNSVTITRIDQVWQEYEHRGWWRKNSKSKLTFCPDHIPPEE